jgi:NTE family protein
VSPSAHPELDLDLLVQVFGELFDGPIDAATLARGGAHALAADTVPEAARRAVIEHRLPSHEWPTTLLRLTAVDVHSGAFEVFDATSGVGLVDAVAASCAVPGIWPPVTIGDRRFMDGGVRSTVNADLASGYDEVVVPPSRARSRRWPGPRSTGSVGLQRSRSYRRTRPPRWRWARTRSTRPCGAPRRRPAAGRAAPPR